VPTRRYAALDPLAEILARLRQDADQLSTAVDLLAGVEVRELRLDLPRRRRALQELIEAIDVDLRAVTVLRAGLPRARRFPDGTPAPRQPTSRQVAYLAGLADAAFARQLGPASGMSPNPRRCVETTAAGRPCRHSALRWTERAVCSSHATPAERAADANAEFDRAQLAREVTLLAD
jgi:hypothetical protein